MKIITTPALATFGVIIAQAAMASFGKVSLIDGGRTNENTQLIGLKIDLNTDDGWKTYWRIAGPNGLDPQFDFSTSENIGKITTYWPEPKLIGEKEGVPSAGYDQDIIVVFEIVPKDRSNATTLKLHADIGVCENICVPVSVTFEQELITGYSIDGVTLHAAQLQAFNDGDYCAHDGYFAKDGPLLVEDQESGSVNIYPLGHASTFEAPKMARSYTLTSEGLIPTCASPS